MAPEKSRHTRRPSSPPIPTYEEATSSDQAEQQALLGANLFDADSASRRRNGYYQPPSVQSARSSEDSTALPAPSSFALGRHSDSEGYGDDRSDDHSEADSDEGLRRDMEQMDVLDAAELEEGHDRRSLRSGWKGRMLAIRRRIGRWKKMSAWRTPTWLQSVHIPWPSWPERWKPYTPSLPVVARLVGLFTIIMLGYAFFVFEVMPRKGSSQMFDPEGLRIFAQEAVDPNRIRDYLRQVTQFSHTAGTEGSELLAGKIREFMWASGLDDVRVDTYWVYLNWPVADGRRVAIINPPELSWEAKLEEGSPYDKADPLQANSLVFHGHSKAGNVTGPLVYANYGSRANYKQLYDSGSDINDTIALVRYGGSEVDAAAKIKAAEEWGVKGVLMYSDPADDGFIRGEVWPNGRFRPEDSVERSSVSLMSRIVGDVLTPGWASTADAERTPVENNPGLVGIPSLPLAWGDAQPLLRALRGHGEHLSAETNGGDWIGGVPDVEWWTGDQTSPIVHLKNQQEQNDKERVFNVMGRITGEVDSAKKIIVGNHRDSWCFGAADPGSGTAVMLEVIGILGQLRAQGWRPVRTIEFASWDGAEYNLLGSTEYVEEHMDELRRDGVAYLNVGAGVTGPDFRAAASPLLQTALLRVLNRVSDPSLNGTVKSIWEQTGKKLDGLGGGSDYVAFQHLAGTSSVDMSFSGLPFPSHSCYETFEWMDRFGDPGFQHHKALAEIWVLLILELAHEPIIPFRLDDYAAALNGYVAALEADAEKAGAPWDGTFDVAPLYDAVNALAENARNFHAWEDWWYGQVYGRGGFETTPLEAQRVMHNERTGGFETDLLDIARDGNTAGPFGVPGREQFKHVVFGPQLWNAHDVAYFPAVRDAMEKQDWAAVQQQVVKTARILRNAAENLRH